MPVLYEHGVMSIVAHIDDDLLFMNPDIAHSLAESETSTTIYITAGDAGGEDWYWQGRETGAKAAYALMAGEDDWIDELVTVETENYSFDIASSYLESAPQVRLYFLRIPDGAGNIEDPENHQSLARLEDGTRATVEAIDDSAIYTREDLVNVLHGLMEAHDPLAFRLQVSDGAFSHGEHTDHIHSTEFALEALDAFSREQYQVSHYVNYQSGQLPPNLTDEDAAFSLEVMEAYVAHDPGATDTSGNLLPVYVDWTMRQYVAESYTVTNEDEPEEDPASRFTYALGDPADNFYFIVDAQTGELTIKDWFTPSLQDPWDANGDAIYEVTLIATPLDGGAPTTQLLYFGTEAEGGLSQIDTPAAPDDEDSTPSAQVMYSLGAHPDNFYFNVDTQTGELTIKDWFTPSLREPWDANGDALYEVTLIATPLDGSAPTSQSFLYETETTGVLTLVDGPVDDENDTLPDDPVDPPEGEPSGQLTYALAGEHDDFYFNIDPQTGELTTKGWFNPSRLDPLDANEDNIFEVTVLATPLDGSAPTAQSYVFETVSEGVLELVSTPLLPNEEEPPLPEADDPDTPTEPVGSGVTFALSGPDAFLFEMNPGTGAISPKDWFVPTRQDAWDQNQDHVYDLIRTGTDDAGLVTSREFVAFDVTRDDTLVLASITDDLILALTDPGSDDADVLLEESLLLEDALI